MNKTLKLNLRLMMELDPMAKATTKSKHPGGRPTKATANVIEKAWQYLTEWRSLGHKVPTVERLSLYLDISKDTLYERAEFSDVLAKLKSMQAAELVDNALDGTYNAPFAKFLLSAKHDYVEKTATDLTTKGKELPTPILGGMSNALQPDDSDQETSQA